MILAVAANPAVDITYRTPHLLLGEVNRVETQRKAGGKALNVARSISQRSKDTEVVGILGGDTGRFIAHELQEARIPAYWVDTDSPTRSTVNVLTSSGESTMLNELGAPPGGHAWDAFVRLVKKRGSTSSVVVVSGSFPSGVGRAEQLALFNSARDSSHCIFDVSGNALIDAATCAPTLLKPNAAELMEATGEPSVERGLATLFKHGAQAVAVSLGAEGMLLATPQLAIRAFLDTPMSGNPTGAGDAAVASFAISIEIHGHLALHDAALARATLCDAVAQSAAAVAMSTAGGFDFPTYQNLLNSVRTENLNAFS